MSGPNAIRRRRHVPMYMPMSRARDGEDIRSFQTATESIREEFPKLVPARAIASHAAEGPEELGLLSLRSTLLLELALLIFARD